VPRIILYAYFGSGFHHPTCVEEPYGIGR
jgi:hypothetical protein